MQLEVNATHACPPVRRHCIQWAVEEQIDRSNVDQIRLARYMAVTSSAAVAHWEQLY